MEPSIDWYFTVVFFIGILGLIVAAILYFVNKDKSFSARILAGYLFCISIVSLHFALTETRFFLKYPHLWRTAVCASLCVSPLAFLYVRTILEQQFRFRLTDFLLFVPAVCYTLSMMPFYLLPAQEKLIIISSFLRDKSLISKEPEGMLPMGWGIMIRMFYGLALVIAQYVLLARWWKKILLVPKPVRQNIDTFKWLFFFTMVLSGTYVLLTIEYIFHISRFYQLNHLLVLTISANILFITMYLLFRPNILYGLTGWLQKEDHFDHAGAATTTSVIADIKHSTLTIEQKQVIKTSLESHFATKQPFLKPRYKIMELSADLKIPTYLLSAFINQEYGKNFSELVNDYRVDYLASFLRDHPDQYLYTLEALCKEAGFNSRTTFIAAVKKKTGRTPSDFYGLILQEEKF